MSNSSLSRLDDWLIDSIFQPTCDWIRMNIGWSKRVPAATFFLISAASLIPYFLWCIENRQVSIIPLLILLNVYQATWFFEKEVTGDEEGLGMTSIDRLEGRCFRKFGLVGLPILCTMLLLFFLMLDKAPETRDISFLTFFVTNLCAAYFLACTDQPKMKRTQLKEAHISG